MPVTEGLSGAWVFYKGKDWGWLLKAELCILFGVFYGELDW
jgi:hypothetical protein